MDYLRSWLGYPSESDDQIVKTKFKVNVVPDIEKFDTKVKQKDVIKQLNRTPTKQGSMEKMELVKKELLLTPQKTYIVMEVSRSIITPRVSSQLSHKQVKFINKYQYNKIKNNNKY